MGDKGFLSSDISVRDLLLNRCDVHHIYPKNHLKKKHNLSKGRYNQIANLVVAQTEINIAIGDKDPQVYFKKLAQQCAGDEKKYGGITKRAVMIENLAANCLPATMLDEEIPDYEDFLKQRRLLMAKKIQTWFHSL